jgi:lia operon protein LiaG
MFRMSKLRWTAALAFACAALAHLAIAHAAHAQTPERYSIPGDAIVVYNLAGNVTIERGTGSNVVIDVVRGGRDAARLEVDRRDVDGRPALVVRYPEGDVVYERSGGNTQINVRRDGTFFGDGSRGDRVSIRRSGRGMNAHADLRILVPADRSVFVRLGVGTVEARDVAGGLDIDVASASVRTNSTRGRLRVDTGSGSVVVNDAAGDEVLIDTGSGSVEVNAIRAGRLTVDTGSGSVRGSGINAPRLHVDTGSGSIRLDDVSSSDVLLDTGSGRVELDVVTQVERVRVDTGSGAVRLTVPADINAALDIDTSSGRIEIDLPITITRRTRSSLVGALGNGGGRIEIDTRSGGVTIRGR